MDDAEWQLLAAMARQFYLEDASKTDLAEQYAMSRFRIARLLKRARDEGVVTIEVNDRDPYRSGLAADLIQHLKLQECLVIRAGETEEGNRRLLARAAASFIRQRVEAGDLLGFSWGRTLVALAQELADLPPCTVLGLTGTVGNDISQSPVEVLRTIAGQSSVEAVAVFSPLFAASEETAASLREEPAITRVQSRYADTDLAVLSVGSWEPPITQLAPIITAEDRRQLAEVGTRAEIAGIFLDDDGTVIDLPVSRRRISVTPDELVKMPRVLAVAGSVEKAPAIAAVARSGLISSLITDDRTAVVLRRMPEVRDHALGR